MIDTTTHPFVILSREEDKLNRASARISEVIQVIKKDRRLLTDDLYSLVEEDLAMAVFHLYEATSQLNREKEAYTKDGIHPYPKIER